VGRLAGGVRRGPDRRPARHQPLPSNCFDGSDNTFEAGHVWTGYAGAWQWELQFAVGWIAFGCSLWTLYAAGRRGPRQTIVALGLSLELLALWIMWVTLQPSPAQRG
jgi:hypothetical protein